MASKHKNPLVAKITSDAFLFYEKYYQAIKTDEDWMEVANEMKRINAIYKDNPLCRDLLFSYYNQLDRERKEKEETNYG